MSPSAVQNPSCAPTTVTSNGQTFGYSTSVNKANHQIISIVSVAGSKRSFDDFKASNLRQPNQVETSAEVKVTISPPVNRLQASKITSLASGSVRRNEGLQNPNGSTPGATQIPELSLAHDAYDLPTQLVQNFTNLGVRAIYPWQSKCLIESGILKKARNLIYTAPTGGGKSLVADIVLLKRVVQEPRKKALVVLPYVALVQEKTRWLRRLVQDVIKTECQSYSSHHNLIPGNSNIRVAGFFGASKSKIGWLDCDIAVCTIEKANLMINTAIEESTIDNLGIIVLDELHMLDDQYRGYIMELMTTKLLLIQTGVQIIGMSATLPNPELLAKWLHAKFFVANYRPIPIDENLVYDNRIYEATDIRDFFKSASQLLSTCPAEEPAKPKSVIEKSSFSEFSNPVTNAVVALAIDNVVSGFGSLVFCGSRQGTQNVASLISKAMPQHLSTQDFLNQRMDVLASLQALPGGFDSTFSQVILCGVGFHHAGLTVEERDVVAEAYDRGILKVMVATCSLAAGVNLPARRVIIYGARMGRDLISPSMLRQMRGRAGRKGKDELGETYLCVQKSDIGAVAELFEAEIPPVASCLHPKQRGIKRAILETIATRLANSLDSLREYVACSLLWQTTDHKQILAMLDTVLSDLVSEKLIEQIAHGAYVPTSLGSAVVASGLTPEDGLFVHSDLRRALSSFVMDSELHLFYLFTPIPQITSEATSLNSEISFPIFRDLINTLDEPSLKALCLVGINPGLINHLANSGVTNLPESTSEEINTARIYRRAYSTFALRDLCNEIPVHRISQKYNLPRGTIQTLAQTCHGFAAGMIKFCQRMAMPPTPTPYNNAFLPSTYASTNTFTAPSTSSSNPDPQASGFSMLATVLEHMQSRLYAGARADLLEMTQVSFVKGRMARLLYESGFKSVRALAEADPRKDILPVMWAAFGWKLKQQHQKQSNHSSSKPVAGEEDRQKSMQELHEMRRQKLEEKLLQKAEVMVASASHIHERETSRIAADFDE